MIVNSLDKEHALKPFMLRQAVALINASPALKKGPPPPHNGSCLDHIPILSMEDKRESKFKFSRG